MSNRCNNDKNMKTVYAFTMFCRKNAVYDIKQLYQDFFPEAPMYRELYCPIADDGSLWLLCASDIEVPNKIMELHSEDWQLRGNIEPIVVESIQYSNLYEISINTIVWASNEKYSLIRNFA